MFTINQEYVDLFSACGAEFSTLLSDQYGYHVFFAQLGTPAACFCRTKEGGFLIPTVLLDESLNDRRLLKEEILQYLLLHEIGHLSDPEQSEFLMNSTCSGFVLNPDWEIRADNYAIKKGISPSLVLKFLNNAIENLEEDGPPRDALIKRRENVLSRM